MGPQVDLVIDEKHSYLLLGWLAIRCDQITARLVRRKYIT